MSSFFIKILPGGTEGGDFYKNPQGLNFTALYADLSLLCFFGFCRLGFYFFFFSFPYCYCYSVVVVRWEKQEKAPAAKRLDGGCK